MSLELVEAAGILTKIKAVIWRRCGCPGGPVRRTFAEGSDSDLDFDPVLLPFGSHPRTGTSGGNKLRRRTEVRNARYMPMNTMGLLGAQMEIYTRQVLAASYVQNGRVLPLPAASVKLCAQRPRDTADILRTREQIVISRIETVDLVLPTVVGRSGPVIHQHPLA